MQSTYAKLPQEIVDMVVECLREERPALKTCRLLSQQWLLAANPRLFCSARLEVVEDFARWHNLIRAIPAIRTHHLRRVEFSPLSRKDYPTSFPDLGCLPTVVSLVWRTTPDTDTDAKKVERFITSFPSLREVSVCGGFASFSEVANFLAMFHGLKTLRLEEVDYDDGGEDSVSRDTVFDASAMEELDIGYTGDQFFNWVADWMLPHSSLQSLSSLRVRADSMSRRAIAQLIDSSAHSMKVLTITPVDDDLGGPYVRKPLPNLHRINFEGIQDENIHGRWPSLHWVTEFISHMPTTPSVATTQFGFYVTENLAAVFKELDWEAIIGTFVSKKFPAVHTVSIRIVTELYSSDTDRSTLEDVLTARLSKLGKLAVVSWDDGS